MITDSPTFCPALWTGINIDQTGDVIPCMHMYGHTVGNVKNNTIQEIISGNKIYEIKQAMANGVWHENCCSCREFENASGASPRTYKIVDQRTKDKINQDINWFEPQHIVINWSNLCNLACTYCNPDTSTAWQAVKKIPINFVRNEHSDLINLVRQQGHAVVGLTLGGGEPLLQKGLLEFLKCLDPTKVRVLVTTNLSINIVSNEVYQELKSWKNVEWQISFDNVTQDKFEYVRYGASWDIFQKNIKIMQADNQYVKAHPAYSIYSAFSIVEYHQYCIENNLDIFWCDLSHPWDLDIRRYPQLFRDKAVNEINQTLMLYTDSLTHDVARETLQRYRAMLLDNSYLVSPEYRVDPVKYHMQLELSQQHKFLELWPEFKEYNNE